MIKKIHKYILVWVMSISIGAVSCVDWLDKTPEAIVDETVAFANFRNFQGFIEEMYNIIPRLAQNNWVSSFNFGDDEIASPIAGDWLGVTHIDRGNFRWYFNNSSFLMKNNWNTNANASHNKDIWNSHWWAIRKANVGIQAIADGLLIDATEEERNILLGQLYFFRGWGHFQIIKWWGGMPFIDSVLPTDEPLQKTRLTFQETATRIGQDFRRAADLLPINWDWTVAGAPTIGNNELRANKIWALGMLGKNYLFAASPLMEHGAGSPARTYNRDFARRAAEALGELLYLVESGQTQYELAPFADYSQVFFTLRQSWRMPGLREAIIRGPNFGADSRWRQNQSYLPAPITGGDNIVLAATANYVNMFGMANGLPLDHPDSGFDPNRPWYNRDPRFYQTIIFDGIQVVAGSIPPAFDGGRGEERWRHARLYTGGAWVEQQGDLWGIRTGYGIRRFIPLTSNEFDQDGGWGGNLHLAVAWLRLADVYLMYAEAVAQATQSPVQRLNSSPSGLTAVDAINRLRDRAAQPAVVPGVGNLPALPAGSNHVHADFLGSLDAFMGELRRERAVELAFEAHRFGDLRRWMLLSQYPYNIKTRQDFDRFGVWDPAQDPRTREVRNFRETRLVTRNFDARHYWMPLPDREVNLYEGFVQNPGW